MKVQDLMRNGPVLELDHEGQIYRLRITRNRKLILTK
ncbi:MAG: hemin uptake protein HemP [Pseudomonadota bacterium]